MKKILLFTLFMAFTATSFGQYRWEVSGGPTFSKFNYQNFDSEIGTGLYFNAGYGYVMGMRAKTSIIFSLEVLQRNSETDFVPTQFDINDPVFETGGTEVKALQIGFNPKFRYLFNSGKDRFRPFINIGPAFRFNTSIEFAGIDLESDQYEQLVLSGVYGAGFSQMVGEMFDILFEVGATNDFTDNFVDSDSKFFDFYARIGVRFRIYDARR